MKNFKVLDGNEACSTNAYLFTEVAGIYPITPASAMAELTDEWSSKGKKNIFGDTVKVIEMQSEAAAAGMMHGSLQAGCLTTTFTASQGLLLMIPNMYKMAGELLPGVIHVAARSLSTHALSISCDHQDIYATRMTGFAILASSSVKQAHDLAVVAHLSAIKGRVPFLHFFDGFRTSHELQKIEVLDEDKIKELIDMDAINEFRDRSLQPKNKVTRGTTQNEDIYFQATEVRNKYYLELPDIVNNYMQEINKLSSEHYAPFVYYGDNKATRIIIAMGSVNETIKETIDYMNKKGEKVGLIEVHLYRPFSKKYFFDVLPSTVKKIAVLDRTKEPGSIGEPLYLDIISVFNNEKRKPFIIGGRYGLSSKNVSPAHIKGVFDFLNNKKNFNGFTVGIEDDVTHLSIPIPEYNVDGTKMNEIFVFGYGSDGMVGASKDILKIVGNEEDKYVQGYFQYDSRKSGGVTRCHIRISDEPIKSTYFITNPNIVVCTKDSYLDKYNLLNGIRKNGIFLLNTMFDENEIKEHLPNNVKRIMAERNVKFYIINAYELARKVGLKNKISTVIESVIFKISNMVDYENVKQKMLEDVKLRFRTKGENVIKANESVIRDAENYIKEIEVDSSWKKLPIESTHYNDFIDAMNRLDGDSLPTSTFLNNPDGTFVGGSTKNEKRYISEYVPSFIKDNCIECNQCSFVCPHAVIRPFLLNEDEIKIAPAYVKNNVKEVIGPNPDNLKFIVAPSIADCTGCGVCANTCPGKKEGKALIMTSIEEENNRGVQEAFDYLTTNVSHKNITNVNTVKGSQFEEPHIEFNGACAGCGQPAYIKLITQLYGDNCIIANATGCSSIYGGSAPSMPYTIPWANSLFEDNAEYGYGMVIANKTIRNRIKDIMEANINNVDEETKVLFNKWLNNINDYHITKEVFDNLKDNDLPKELIPLKDYIPSRSIWTIGGDGWAYDIGFGGLDHVISTNDNVNILVLDTEVYSNTGGQSSKSSKKGSIAKFTANGKRNNKKDLARIALSYPHVYVATVSLGANMQQYIKAINEAESYDGPSLIIAYAPCIAHGIDGGLENSVKEEKLAVECGYFPLFRYNPTEAKFYLDSKEPNFDLYEDFLNNETRYSMLKLVNSDKASELLEANKNDAMRRFNYYKKLSEEA
jgi:pyruvate-ferredoxin/flavodoxin oxidoreductase